MTATFPSQVEDFPRLCTSWDLNQASLYQSQTIAPQKKEMSDIVEQMNNFILPISDSYLCRGCPQEMIVMMHMGETM